MLRWLVLLMVVLNGALYAWSRNGAPGVQDDREPQRLQHQVAPESIQVLPDLPTGPVAARAGATTAASAGAAASGASAAFGATGTTAEFGASGAAAASSAASGVAAVASAASGAAPARASTTGATLPSPSPAGKLGATAPAPTSTATSSAAPTLARATGDVELTCAESGPLDDLQLATLHRALVQAGVAPGALAERRQPSPGNWMVYMGRFVDDDAWQRKADELKRLNLKFDRVNAPPALEPGLSLGAFGSAAEAAARLAELARRGVHTARVVMAKPPGVVRRLQVRSAGNDWRQAVGATHFAACSATQAETL